VFGGEVISREGQQYSKARTIFSGLTTVPQSGYTLNRKVAAIAPDFGEMDGGRPYR